MGYPFGYGEDDQRIQEKIQHEIRGEPSAIKVNMLQRGRNPLPAMEWWVSIVSISEPLMAESRDTGAGVLTGWAE